MSSKPKDPNDPPDSDPYFSEDYEEEYSAGDDPAPDVRAPFIPRDALDDRKRIAALLKSWVDSPKQFALDAFGQKPREWQPDALDAVVGRWDGLQHPEPRRYAIKACRKAGKTVFAAYLVLWWAVTRPFSLVLTTAPTGRQIKQGLWSEIRRLWQGSILPQLFPAWYITQTTLVTSHPTWRAFGVSSDRGEKIEAPHGKSVLIVYDEAKAIRREIYDVFQGFLADGEWKEVAISTPGAPMGWFYDCFSSQREHWATDTIASNDPRVTRLRQKHDEELEMRGPRDSTYRRQQLAEFAGAEEGGLIALSDIEACVGLGIEKRGRWKRVMGVDPSGTGQDETAVCFRYGPVVLRMVTWDGVDEMESVGRLVQLAKEFRPDTIVVDKPGLGGPMISRLREVGFDIDAFNPGAAAFSDDDHDNLKTEVAYGLQRRFIERAIAIPNDDKLIGQLASYRVKTSSRGRNRLVDPSDSPDRADALICAFAADFVGPSVFSYSPEGV